MTPKSAGRKKYYSGNNSRRFWNMVSKIKCDKAHAEVYVLGVMLQNLEEYVLRKLREAL